MRRDHWAAKTYTRRGFTVAEQYPEIEVIVAKSAGTCFGVEAAINIAEKIRKPILGPLVHNPKIVGDLASQGIPILERYADLDDVEGLEEVVITAHGYPKELKAALRERGITFHDATCPVLLKWVYRKIETFEREGYHVILIGNPDHAEIIASRSYGTDISVVYDEDAVDLLRDGIKKTVAICQTTITKEKFDRVVACIRERKYPNLRAVDTRCKPVKNQQEAVAGLAQWVDAMLIVGGYDSSNTTNLARIAKEHLPARTYHIDSDALIQRDWLVGVRHLGIGAGTSTPKEQIEAVQDRIAAVYPGAVVFRTGDGSR
ncbi:MAG: 4-hydroxy-3-methylbut-2-enyl diphosphate reductase [Candidatus Poribacteria bacterium]